jgi:transposase
MSGRDELQELKRRYAELEGENRRLRLELERSQARERELFQKVERLEAENRKLRERIATLEEALSEADRAKHRQTSRFPRRHHVIDPKKPGSKKGHAPRLRSQPDRVDRVIDVPPGICPHCDIEVAASNVHEQFQIDLPPVVPIVTQFNVQSGYCSCCGKFVQGRHPEQISDAIGAAGVQIGPTILTMAAELKHRLGVPYRKVCDFFENYFDLTIAPATFCRAEQRLADKALPTYNLLIEALRKCGVVHADETGWRVGRLNSWLWVFCSKDITVYAIRTGKGARGKEVPEEILGTEFEGVLIVDGLASYDAIECKKGRCIGHILRRASGLAETAAPNDANYLRRLIDILKDAMDLADRREKTAKTDYESQVAEIERRLTQWLGFFGYDPSDELKKLANHLRHYRDQWLVFLYDSDVPPTNNHAERMIRPSLAIRKIGGCNKSLKGALVHQVLTSIMVTCRQRAMDLLGVAQQLLRNKEPVAIPLKE